MGHKVSSLEDALGSGSGNMPEMPDFPSGVGVRSSLFRKRYLYLAVMMSLVAGIAIAGLLLDLVLKTSGSDPLIEIAVISLLIWVFPTAYLVSRARDAYLQHGLLHIPLPIRRFSGRRTWQIPLRDVVQATAITHEDGDTGVLLRLNDGAEARLWLSDMPPGGKQFLERLLTRFAR